MDEKGEAQQLTVLEQKASRLEAKTNKLKESLEINNKILEYWELGLKKTKEDHEKHEKHLLQLEEDITQLLLELDTLVIEDSQNKQRRKLIYAMLLKHETSSTEKKDNSL